MVCNPDSRDRTKTKKAGTTKQEEGKTWAWQDMLQDSKQQKGLANKAANNLLSGYPFVALENLKLKKMTEEHGKGIYDAEWNIFMNIISLQSEGSWL